MKTISLISLFFLTVVFGYCEMSVFVVVIDGARFTETFGDPTLIPHIWNDLRPVGSINTSFYNTGLTETCPGHATVATGTWQNILNDGSQRPDKPTFFEYLRKSFSISSTKTWDIAGKDKLYCFSYSTDTDYGSSYGASVYAPLSWMVDDSTYNVLISTINTHHPQLTVINFADVDKIAHTANYSGYTAAIYHVDYLISQLWSVITSDSYYRDSTVLMITNDHGRHTTDYVNHGDGCDGCRHIMFLAIGTGIRQNYISTYTRYQSDICPTVANILNFTASKATGNLMDEIFEPVSVNFSEFEAAYRKN